MSRIAIPDTRILTIPLNQIPPTGNVAWIPPAITPSWYQTYTLENDNDQPYIVYGLTGQLYRMGVLQNPAIAINTGAYLQIKSNMGDWFSAPTQWFAVVGSIEALIPGSRPFWFTIPIKLQPYECITIELGIAEFGGILATYQMALTFNGGEYYKHMYENYQNERRN